MREMKNLNKLRLEYFTGFSPNSETIAAGLTTIFKNLDRQVNDIGRPMKITAINISAMAYDSNGGFNNIPTVSLALGFTNKYDVKTNIFEWLLTYANSSTGEHEAITVVNQTIGNFKDEIFTLEPFTAEVMVGNASKGEIHMNYRAENLQQGQAVFRLKAVIILYYK